MHADPYAYSYRELLEMARGAWDPYAALCHLVATALRSKKGKMPPFEDFHPYREAKTRGGIPLTVETLHATKHMLTNG